jgi:hypothetical protein
METFKSILMRKIAQLPSVDFVRACIFLLTTVLVLLFSVLAWLAK